MASSGATWVLDAVERWARGYWLVRETGIAMDGSLRIDGLLVPVSCAAQCMVEPIGGRPASRTPFFARPRIVGVEVKASRADFLAGLRRDQFAAYRDQSQLAGLYVATPNATVKPGELPEGVGHLVVRNLQNKPAIAVCRRKPELSDTFCDTETAWRLLFKCRREMALREHEMQVEAKDRKRVFGEVIRRRVMKMIDKLEREAEPDRAGRVKGER